MASDLGPFEVGYPVDFRSGGDTTREAFGKHIQEILKIYGDLNALDSGKASSLEIAEKITEHVNASNPHPNWKPSLSFSDLTGTLDASKVIGTLINAYIAATHITGLENYVKSVMQANPPDLSELEYDEPKIESNNGYMKLPNGMIMQWGVSTVAAKTGRLTFPIGFPTACVSVTGCTYINDDETNGRAYGDSYNFFHINTWNRLGFGYATLTENHSGRYVSYQAIGY